MFLFKKWTLIGVLATNILFNSGMVQANETAQKVTFVELGSVNCIPCRMMQPVMKSLENKYPQDLKVLFIDVWTESGKEQAKAYTFRAIPTQIFLDAQGNIFHKHEGFYPEAAIEKVIQQHGVEH